MIRPSWKVVALGIVWLGILCAILYTLTYFHNLPKNDPDKFLRIEARVVGFFDRVALPIRIAKLSALEPDKQLLMPVHGHRISEITDTWNAPRSEGRLHEGQDIFASRGTPVFSATGGYVLRSSSTELGGNSLYIVGAGGVRYYYAHLDRFADGISVGDKVTTDTVIGFVGNTGNAEATPSHLHFGMYIARDAANPLPLLINR